MWINLLLSLYLTVFAFSLLCTWREQRASGVNSPLFRATGYLMCGLWPFTTFCFALLICVRRG